MPELWELCNNKSKVILAYLYKQENNHYPDWYLILIGEKPSEPIKPVIDAPDYE